MVLAALIIRRAAHLTLKVLSLFAQHRAILAELIRSKGYFWLATRPLFCAQWSQAGGIAHYGFAGMFYKAIPKKLADRSRATC
ncbi:GTP-binding protein [Pseudoalteromonas sp. Hal099]